MCMWYVDVVPVKKISGKSDDRGQPPVQDRLCRKLNDANVGIDVAPTLYTTHTHTHSSSSSSSTLRVLHTCYTIKINVKSIMNT